MQKGELFVLVAALFGGLFIAAVVTSQDRYLARVNQIDGLYIYCESQPVVEGVSLGTVKAKGVTWNNEPQELLRLFVKQAKKHHPTANAIVINSDFSRAEAYHLE